MYSIEHNTDDVRDFLIYAALCFEDGVNAVFDHIAKQQS
jgi:hypothetical protein